MAPQRSPVWAFVLVAAALSAGNQKAKCKGCGKEATQAPTQWWPHFLECDGSLNPETAELAKAAAEKFFKDKADAEARKARVSTGKQQKTIPGLSQQQLCDAADEALARWAFATGQPLLSVDDFYLREALKAVAAAGRNRKPLDRKRLKEKLLPAEKARLKRKQQEMVGNDIKLYGRCIVSDGWTDATGKPIINILLVAPSGDEFVEAIDTSGNKKTMQYIANAVGKHIDEDVDLVIMDGACKVAIDILMGQFDWLSGVVCTTHSLDLLMEDIGKMEFAADHLKDARDVVHFIKNHHATSALFSKLSDVKLLAPSTTRFGFNLMMVQRLLRCEGALRTLVTSVEWRDWRNAQKKPEVKAHAS
jgi:hypothetical protein